MDARDEGLRLVVGQLGFESLDTVIVELKGSWTKGLSTGGSPL